MSSSCGGALQSLMCATPTRAAGVFELIDLDRMLTLLVSAAFVSGFALVALNASQVFFLRRPTGTTAFGGVPITEFMVDTDHADRVRKDFDFIVYVVSMLILFYFSFLAAGIAAEAVLQAMKYMISEYNRLNGATECARSKVSFHLCVAGQLSHWNFAGARKAFSLLVFKIDTLQYFFACLWLAMIWGIVKILRMRVNWR